MAKKLPALHLYTGDWLKDPQLSLCSPATRGIWVDLLCAMHNADRCGKLVGTADQLARLARCCAADAHAAVTELRANGAADVTVSHDVFTIVNRRMNAEYNERESARLRQQRRRESRNSHGDGNDVVPEKSRALLSSSSSFSSSRAPLCRRQDVYGEPAETGAEPPDAPAPGDAQTRTHDADALKNLDWGRVTETCKRVHAKLGVPPGLSDEDRSLILKVCALVQQGRLSEDMLWSSVEAVRLHYAKPAGDRPRVPRCGYWHGTLESMCREKGLQPLNAMLASIAPPAKGDVAK